jgi:DNA-3-methyladenine glycosylase I
MAFDDGKIRCWGKKDPLMRAYHDNEWGVPVHDDQVLFEFILLEGVQAGLNWSIVLKRRENYRQAFDNFNYNKISNYSSERVNKLLLNKGIIRNRRKIESHIKNAKAFLKVQKEFGSFDEFLWSYIDHKPIMNNFVSWNEVPTKTELSTKISNDLKKRGFSFVGPTIMYAYMQSIGMVNDHHTYCFRWKVIKDLYGK